MRLPGQNGTDQGLAGCIEQHRMAGLPDPDLIDHREERIEPIGGFDCPDHRMLPVIENRHGDVDGFFRRPERAFMRRNQPADIDLLRTPA